MKLQAGRKMMETYFDANATTPLSPAASEAWLAAAREHWHNPSSLYPEAIEAKRFLEDLRESLAGMLGCSTGRIVFTSGATEANNSVLMHAAGYLEARGGFFATSAIEHPSVAEGAEFFFRGGQLQQIGVTPEGVIDQEMFASVVKGGQAGFVSLMAANNETGVWQPWREVSGVCREAGIPFHCDAAQWIGKESLEGLAECAFVTASAHKFGGPPGAGFLLIPEGSDFRGSLGGPQERGHRGGTENLPAIAAMVAALKGCGSAVSGEFRDQFEADLVDCLPGVRILGGGAKRLGNTSMFILPEHKNLRWLTRLGRRGFAVSTGSACSAGQGNPSRVMQAMGCRFEEMGRVLRISALPQAGAEEWEGLLDALLEVRDELGSGAGNSSAGIPKISLADL
ncbi:aminotransferase class V-fold PLP-dependent enzyme [Verrucomicrobiaceae bacterium 227]